VLFTPKQWRFITARCGKKEFEGMAKYSYNRIRCSRALLFRLKLTICVVAVSVFASVFTGCKDNLIRNGMNLVHQEKIRGDVELAVNVQKGKQTGGSGARKSSTSAFNQTLSLNTRGNVYHPKLLSYTAAIGVGLIRQDFQSDDGSQKTSGMVHNYSFSADLLKAKPYPISFYTNKSEGLRPRQFRSALKTEKESSGAKLALRTGNWPMNFHYSTTSEMENSFGSSSSDMSSTFSGWTEDRFRYELSHSFSSSSDFNFNFERSERISKSGTFSRKRLQDVYQGSHSLGFGATKQHSLSSFLSFTETTDNSSTSNFRLDEKLNLWHSSNLSTNYAFRLTENQNNSAKNNTANLEVAFVHQLYKSLTTTGGVKLTKSKYGSTYENQRKQASLSFNYRKLNKLGTFSSSYYTRLSQNEQSGGSGVAVVIGEVHDATIDPVILNHRNVDISSIRLEDEFGNPYGEGDDYSVSEVNGRVHLTLSSLGAFFPSFSTLDGTEEFFVDYEYFVEPEREETSLFNRFYVRHDFRFGLGLFYEHSTSNQTISSNLTDIAPDESVADSYGFNYRKGRFTMFGQYRTLDSTQIVSNVKTLKARYSWSIYSNTTANIHASKEIYSYTFPSVSQNAIFRFGSDITTDFNSRLSMSGSIDYLENDIDGGEKTAGIQFRSNLKYKYRQISLSAGLDYNALKISNSKNDTVFVYVRAKRFF
jgi:hypothetical protein